MDRTANARFRPSCTDSLEHVIKFKLPGSSLKNEGPKILKVIEEYVQSYQKGRG
jgi:hypothetical protein